MSEYVGRSRKSHTHASPELGDWLKDMRASAKSGRHAAKSYRLRAVRKATHWSDATSRQSKSKQTSQGGSARWYTSPSWSASPVSGSTPTTRPAFLSHPCTSQPSETRTAAFTTSASTASRPPWIAYAVQRPSASSAVARALKSAFCTTDFHCGGLPVSITTACCTSAAKSLTAMSTNSPRSPVEARKDVLRAPSLPQP